MTTLPRPNRFGRVQVVASTLLCGGIFAISLPWLLTTFAEAEKPSAMVLPLAKTNLHTQIDLPEQDLTGKAALECDLKLLKDGLRRLEQTKDYSGTFRKQERINGVLDAGALIQVKGRHEPLSLYLKWLKGDTGRELLWVDGERDGEMLVRLGGIRGRLLPAIKLNPDGDVAREKVRHHISNVSILNLTRQVVEHAERDTKATSGIRCELEAHVKTETGEFIRVTTHYDSPNIAGEYRKAIHFIHRETLLPVRILTYGWPDEGQKIAEETMDEETLLEDYEYSDLQFDHHFADLDFSDQNPDYAFRRGR